MTQKANSDYAPAVALFNFSSQNPDELPISENEELSILLGQCDKEGWLMAVTLKGARGYVPENYIEFRPVQQQQSLDRASIQHQVSHEQCDQKKIAKCL